MSALCLCLEHSRSVSYAHLTEQLCIELHLGDRSSHKETSSGCVGRIFAVRRVLDVSIYLASRGDEFKRYRSHSTNHQEWGRSIPCGRPLHSRKVQMHHP